MRCFTPEYADGAALIDKVRAARRMGVEDFRFYNYGLIPQIGYAKRFNKQRLMSAFRRTEITAAEGAFCKRTEK